MSKRHGGRTDDPTSQGHQGSGNTWEHWRNKSGVTTQQTILNIMHTWIVKIRQEVNTERGRTRERGTERERDGATWRQDGDRSLTLQPDNWLHTGDAGEDTQTHRGKTQTKTSEVDTGNGDKQTRRHDRLGRTQTRQGHDWAERVRQTERQRQTGHKKGEQT